MVSDLNILFGSILNLPKKKKKKKADFALQNMVETMLPDGLQTSGQRAKGCFEPLWFQTHGGSGKLTITQPKKDLYPTFR